MPTITRYLQHLPKAIACCLLTMPCHAAANTTINVTVKAMDNTTYNIQISPTATVQDLKQKIKDQSNIQRAQQHLIVKQAFTSSHLTDNTKTLANCNIKNGSTITLTKKPTYQFPLRIQYKDQVFNITVNIAAKNNLNAIKKAIYRKKKYSVKTQQLFNGQTMINDQAPFESYNIDEDTTTLQLTLTSDKPASNRKSIPPKNIKFNVKIIPNTTITITMAQSATIADLKQKIKEQQGTDVAKQMIIFKGTKLTDNQILAKCGIQSNVKVFMKVLPKFLFNTQVKMKNQTWNIPVNENTTIRDIKALIWTKTKHDVQKQQLFNKGQELKDPNQHYNVAGIQKGDTLQLTLKPNKPASNRKNIPPKNIQVNIKTPTNKTINISIAPSATIAQLKQAIQQQQGTEVAKQKLTLNRKQLEDHKTLATYHIQNGAIVNMAIGPKYLFDIKVTMDNETWSHIPIYENTIIRHIKQAILSQTTYAISNQNLFKQDQELKNAQLAKDASIKKGDTLQLTLKHKKTTDNNTNTQPDTIQFNVKTPTGQSINMHMPTSTTIAQLKQHIQDKNHLNTADQTLMYNTQQLEDQKTLHHYHITQNATLNLQTKPIFNITVSMENATWKDIPVYQDTTIQSIKQHIQKKKGHPVHKQQLLNDKGQALPNTQHYTTAGIQANTTLTLKTLPNTPRDNNNRTQNPPKTLSERTQKLAPYGIILGIIALLYAMTSKNKKKSYRNTRNRNKNQPSRTRKKHT